MSYVGKITDTAGNTHLVGSTLYGTCTTGSSTAAKVVTCSDFDNLITGATIHVKFTNSNYSKTGLTLNVNSTGAKPIVGKASGEALWYEGSVVSFTYDGTSWIQNASSWTDNDTLNTAGSTNNASKLFLIGATSQATSPQTYSNSHVYATNGTLYAQYFNGVSLDKSSSGLVIAGDDGQVLVPSGAYYDLGDACEKGVDTAITSGSSSDDLPTTAAVVAYVASQITGASAYKGAVDAESDLLNVALTAGWYYVVTMPNAQTTSITIGGKVCEAGDMIFINTAGTYTTSSALGAAIDVVQNNIETLTTTDIDNIWAAA